MKIGIVGSDRDEWHIKRLLKELGKQGAEAYLLPITKFKSGIASHTQSFCKRIYYR